MLQKFNQKGFAAVESLLILVILIIVVGTGLYVVHAKQAADKNLKASAQTSAVKASAKKPTAETDAAKIKKIENYDLASTSFKTALLNDFYSKAKSDCDVENASVSPEARLSTVILVRKMVRDDFASAQFCGSSGTSLFAKVNGKWKIIGSLAMAPNCTLVDQYKVSKQITSVCLLDNDASREVTYE